MVRHRRSGFERATAVIAACALLAGCGYRSSYTAPPDGRARPVWKDSDVAVEMAGAPLSPSCAGAMAEASQTGQLRLATGELRLDGGYWTPRYYGPRIIVVGRLAPPFLRPPIFFPRLGGGGFSGGPRMGFSNGAPRLGTGGGGGGGGLGKGAAYLAILVIVTLSIVDIVVSLTPAESSTSTQAIDQVNAFNDMARMIGSPCSYAQYGGGY